MWRRPTRSGWRHRVRVRTGSVAGPSGAPRCSPRPGPMCRRAPRSTATPRSMQPLRDRGRAARSLGEGRHCWVQQVGPVPPVERRSGNQGVQTAREREGPDQQGDRERCAHQCRAHRHRGPTPPRFECEPHPDGPGDRNPCRQCAADDARAARRRILDPNLPGRPCAPPSGDRDGPEAADEHRESDPQYRPVHCDPGVGIDGPYRSEWRKWGETDRDAEREGRAEYHRGTDADEPVATGEYRGRPLARAAHGGPRFPDGAGGRSPVRRGPGRQAPRSRRTHRVRSTLA